MYYGFPPVFIIALLTLGCLLSLPAWPQSLPWLMAAAVFCAALGNACCAGTGAITGLSSLSFLRKTGRLLLCLALGLGAGAGCLSGLKTQEQTAFSGAPLNRVQTFFGIVVKDSSGLPDGRTGWEMELTGVSTSAGRLAAGGRVKLVYPEKLRLYQGELLAVEGRLAGVSALPGVQFTGRARAVKQLGFRNSLDQGRMMLRKRLDAAIDRLGYPASELFRGLFLGEKEDFPATLALGFTRTGTLHLLALSGMHVGIIFGLLWLLLRPLPGRYYKLIVIALVLLFYLWLTGPEPSLLRATLMLFLTWCSLLLWQRTEPLAILGGALLIILVLDPLAAFSLGLQFSFLAMTGLILFTRGLERFFTPYLPRWAALPLASSLAAQITTLPLVLLNFGLYYPANILVTMLLVPLITVYMWLGLFTLLAIVLVPVVPWLSGAGGNSVSWPVTYWFMFWLGIQDLSRWLLKGLYYIILAINDFFAAWPGIQVQADALSLKAGMLVYGLLILVWLLKKRSKIEPLPLRNGYEITIPS